MPPSPAVTPRVPPPPTSRFSQLSTLLHAPLGFPFADRYGIAYLHARAFQRFENTQALELFLQVLGAFFAVQIGHGHQPLDPLSAHTVHALFVGFDGEPFL